MLHLMKLAVGIRTIAEFAAPPDRRRVGPPTWIGTRHMPKRAEEVLDGGSLYWVIANTFALRQPILAIDPYESDDGSKRTRLTLQPTVTLLTPRTIRPFQGWRYLPHASTPPDLEAADPASADLPPHLRQALASLCLL